MEDGVCVHESTADRYMDHGEKQKQKLLMAWPKRGVALRGPPILLPCRDLSLGAPSSVSLLQ